MHAPDGFYSIGLCLVVDAACLGIIGYCIKKVWGKLDHPTIRLAASVGALVFAMEMANFCVSKGSSCHFMGGVFAAIVLGPYMSTIVVSLMHIIQFFIFQDGGLLSIGPNLLTIVIISTFLGYYLYRSFRSLVIEPYGIYIGAFISAWLTLLITAISVCVMLAISGVDPLSVTLGPMVGPHVMVGVMEGIITVILLIFIQKISPGSMMFSESDIKKADRIYSKTWIFLLFLALFIGIILSPFASRKPDGLEKLALDRGFAETHVVVYYHAPLANYLLPCSINNKRISGSIAGLLGVIITFCICWITGILFIEQGEKTQKKDHRSRSIS